MGHVLDDITILETGRKVYLRRWKEMVRLGLVDAGIIGMLIAHIPNCKAGYPVKFVVMQMLAEGSVIIVKTNAGEK